MPDFPEMEPRAAHRGNAAIVRSVFLQLDLGLTYCRLFKAAYGPNEASWFRKRAQKALDAALRASGFVAMRYDELDQFSKRAADLREKLGALDERQSKSKKPQRR